MAEETLEVEQSPAERSVYVFESHLTPWEACVNLNFANARLSPDFIAACNRDHLTLLTLSTPGLPFAFVLNRARELAQRLVDAHALFCASNAHLLEHDSTMWLEVKGVRQGEAVAGYMHRSLGSGPLDPEHPDNVALHEAAALVNAWAGIPGLMLALGDFRAARREPGPYYAFHAFRVLEDIRDVFPGTRRHQRWAAMNAALGTTESTWSEQTDASEKARHLNPSDIVWLMDPDRHARVLDSARDALRRFIASLPTLHSSVGKEP